MKIEDNFLEQKEFDNLQIVIMVKFLLGIILLELILVMM